MKELLEYLARELVDEPDEVQVEEVDDDRGVLLTLRVAKDDMGKVIGRGGRTARAIRSIMKAAAVREVVKIETATEPEFQAEFVAAMSFPHATAATTHLAASVANVPGDQRTHALGSRGMGLDHVDVVEEQPVEPAVDDAGRDSVGDE